MEKRIVQVPNIGCNGCVRTIVGELQALDGVKQVQGDVNTKSITVEWGSPATWEKIKAKLVEIDYPPAGA